MAPAKANLEYRLTPESFWGALAFVVSTMPPSFCEPVVEGAVEVAMPFNSVVLGTETGKDSDVTTKISEETSVGKTCRQLPDLCVGPQY